MKGIVGIQRAALALIASAALVGNAARAQNGSEPETPATTQARPAGTGGVQQASERGDPPARNSKRTVLHFEDDSIRGDLTRPDGELVQAPRRVAEGSLVRLRKSFVDRALGSAVRGE